MRSTASAIGFLLFLAFAIVFLNSCGVASGTDCFAYASPPFTVKAEGNIDNSQINATVYYTPESTKSQRTSVMTVIFMSPQELERLTVTLFSDGSTSARIGSLCAEGSEYRELLVPFYTLLGNVEYSSIKKTDNGEKVVQIKNEHQDLSYYFKDNSQAPYKIQGNTSGRQIVLTLSDFSFE